MLNEFGKFCRKLRIDKNEILKDMADKLEVSVAFLSAVENGNKSVPKDWCNNITLVYGLNEEQQEELKYAIIRSEEKLSLKSFQEEEKDLLISFARKLDSLTDDDKKSIFEILKSKK